MAEERVRALAGAIEKEAAAFDAFVEGQRAFGTALRGRDWPSLHRAIGALEALAGRIAEAEDERARAETFLRLELGVLDDDVRSLAFRLSEPGRSELLDLHRRLRVSAMRARLENQALGEYAEANKGLIAGVLEELFPEKKTRIYGPSGRTVQSGNEALVLDAAL